MSTRLRRPVVTIVNTPDVSRTLHYPADRAGTTFVNVHPTLAAEFYLPTPNHDLLGVWYEFLSLTDQAIRVYAPVGKLVGKGNAAATWIGAQTAGQLYGARLKAECVEKADGVFCWAAAGVASGSLPLTYTVGV